MVVVMDAARRDIRGPGHLARPVMGCDGLGHLVAILCKSVPGCVLQSALCWFPDTPWLRNMLWSTCWPLWAGWELGGQPGAWGNRTANKLLLLLCSWFDACQHHTEALYGC